MLDLVFVRDRASRRETKLLNVLLMIKSTLWKGRPSVQCSYCSLVTCVAFHGRGVGGGGGGGGDRGAISVHIWTLFEPFLILRSSPVKFLHGIRDLIATVCLALRLHSKHDPPTTSVSKFASLPARLKH